MDQPKHHTPPFAEDESHDPQRLNPSQDNPAGYESSSHGSQGGESSKGSGQAPQGDSHEKKAPPTDYEKIVARGTRAAKYMQLPESDIVADLVKEKVASEGYKIASPFTNLDDLKKNGWNAINETNKIQKEFALWVPFPNALEDLGMSDEAVPKGKNEFWSYDHVFEWVDSSDDEITEVRLVHYESIP